MRSTVAFSLVACCWLSSSVSCRFAHSEPADGDAMIDEGGPKPDALAGDAMTDARVCPAMIGCTAFQCASTSSCYYYCTTKTTWALAQSACDDVPNGCLVNINDLMEQQCVVANVMPTFVNYPWLGFVQAGSGVEPAGGWSFSCGPTTYTNWATGEPNDADVPGEDCAGMSDGGTWFDTDCTDPGRYVCEVTN